MSVYDQVIDYAKHIRENKLDGIWWVYVDKNLNVSLIDKLPDEYYMKNNILVVDDPKEYLINIHIYKKEPSKSKLDEFIYHGNTCKNVKVDYKPYKKELFKEYRGSVFEEKGKKISLWLYGLRFLLDSYKNLCGTYDILFWRDHKFTYNIDETLYDDHLNYCLKNNEVRFIVFLIDIPLGGDESHTHANIALYDKKTRDIDYFEPQGYADLSEEISYEFSQFLYNYNIDINHLYKPSQICTGPQTLEYEETTSGIWTDRSGGFCAMWTLWYIDLRLSNPDINRNELLKCAINNIRSKQPLSEFIRGYTQFIRDNVYELYI